MTTLARNIRQFTPSRTNGQALLDRIYGAKFSKRIPLLMVLCFAGFAVWRTHHYITVRTGVNPIVGILLALSIELAMIGSSALCFITMRASYVHELREQDAHRSAIGVRISYLVMAVTTIALLLLAGADAGVESNGDFVFIALMTMIQMVQSCAIIIFVNIADVDERDLVRDEHIQYLRDQEALRRAEIQSKANECPHCFKPLEPNNRQRHIDSCPMKP